ncbi:MAG: metal ABC transporter substrate-binding protein [Deltaproteobacteria bacterium]|nr:metal ABC transporter substrate-binding protein [Deltaproteobacteria bacterium]
MDVLVGRGQSPHAYEPSPRRVAALSDARAVFFAGIPFEKISAKN